MVLATAEEFVEQQELSIKQTRAVTQRLFELAEQLAQKQIESNPKNFMLKQLKQSVLVSEEEEKFHNVMDPVGKNKLIQEESKELVPPNKKGQYIYSIKKSIAKGDSDGMNEYNEDLDDEEFFDAFDELQG